MSPLSISVCFSSEIIDFASVHVPIILNGHSLNIVNFLYFSKNPVFGVHPTPVTSNFVKIPTISESDKI